jgi:hypothetical protein
MAVIKGAVRARAVIILRRRRWLRENGYIDLNSLGQLGPSIENYSTLANDAIVSFLTSMFSHKVPPDESPDCTDQRRAIPATAFNFVFC